MKKTLLFSITSLFVFSHCFTQTSFNTQTSVNESSYDDSDTTLIMKAQESSVDCHGKKIYLKKGGDNGIFFQGTSFNYNAGDTLVLKASQNPYSYVSLDYFTKGTDACPVVVTNEGGQVILTNFDGESIPGGFGFTGSTHMKLTGTGSSDKYGFKVTTPDNRGVGVDIQGRSSNFEIDHLEIYNKASGFWVKHEADCADSLQFPHWVIHNIEIHDNFIHNCVLEGMYLGSTDPNGLRAIVCNGDTIHPLPMRLGNMHIYNNTIDSCGRGAIQLSGADSGHNEIDHNTVTNIGYEYNAYQGNGIVLGGYTHGYVHDNTIDHTYSTGLYSLGAGYIVIRNNTINHSGNLNGYTTNGMASIMVDTRATTNPSPGKKNPVMTTFKVIDNKCGVNTDFDVRVYNSYLTYSKSNIICNNVSITGAGVGSSKATVTVPTNINFINTCKTETSQVQSAVQATVINKNSVFIFPNPAVNTLNVNVNETISGKIALVIYDEQGRMLQTKSIYKNNTPTQTIIDIRQLTPGLYNLQIINSTSKTNLKFIKE